MQANKEQLPTVHENGEGATPLTPPPDFSQDRAGLSMLIEAAKIIEARAAESMLDMRNIRGDSRGIADREGQPLLPSRSNIEQMGTEAGTSSQNPYHNQRNCNNDIGQQAATHGTQCIPNVFSTWSHEPAYSVEEKRDCPNPSFQVAHCSMHVPVGFMSLTYAVLAAPQGASYHEVSRDYAYAHQPGILDGSTVFVLPACRHQAP